jgi:hypothetical protein
MVEMISDLRGCRDALSNGSNAGPERAAGEDRYSGSGFLAIGMDILFVEEPDAMQL